MYKPGVILRRMTGLGLAALFVAMWVLRGWYMRTALTLFGVLAVWEVYDVLAKRGYRPVRWVGVVYMAAVTPVYFFAGGIGAVYGLTLLCIVLSLGAPVIRGDIEDGSLLSTLFPLFYPGMLFLPLIAQTSIDVPLYETVAIGCTYLIAMMSDLFAYEIGTLYGKRPLAPAISPKKTVEGAIAGLIASVAASILVPVLAELACRNIPLFQPYAAPLPPLWQFAILGLVGGLASQIGDLAASMIKRYCGVKDYGTIFPGHGGVMDRIDGILFCGVCVHFFIALVWR